MGRECQRCIARAAAASARLQTRDANRDETARSSSVAPRVPTPRRRSPKSFTERHRRNSGTWSGNEEEDYRNQPPPCPLHHPHPASYSRCTHHHHHTGSIGGTTSNSLGNTGGSYRSVASTGGGGGGRSDGRSPSMEEDNNNTTGGGGDLYSTMGRTAGGMSLGTTNASIDEQLLAVRRRREEAPLHTCARCTCPGFINANGRRQDHEFMKKSHVPSRSPRRLSPKRRNSPRFPQQEVDSWRRDVERSGFDRTGSHLPEIRLQGASHNRQFRRRMSDDSDGDGDGSGRRRRSRRQTTTTTSDRTGRGSGWNESTFVPKLPLHAQRRSVHRRPRQRSSHDTKGGRRGGSGRSEGGGSSRQSARSGASSTDGGDFEGMLSSSPNNGYLSDDTATLEAARRNSHLRSELGKHAIEQAEWAEEMALSKTRTSQNAEKIEYYLGMIATANAKLESVEADHAAQYKPILDEFEYKKRLYDEKVDMRIRAIQETEDAHATCDQCFQDVDNLRLDIENARADRVLNFIPRVPNTDGIIVSSTDIGRSTTWEQDRQLSEYNDLAAARTAEATLKQRALRRQQDRDTQLNLLQTLLVAKGGGADTHREPIFNTATGAIKSPPIQIYRTCDAVDVHDLASGAGGGMDAGVGGNVLLLHQTTEFGCIPPSTSIGENDGGSGLGEGVHRRQLHVPEALLAPFVPMLSHAVNATSAI